MLIDLGFFLNRLHKPSLKLCNKLSFIGRLKTVRTFAPIQLVGMCTYLLTIWEISSVS